MAKNEIDKNLVFKAGLFIAGYFVIVKPLLQFIGLKEDKEDKENKSSLQTILGWNPEYWLAIKAKGIKSSFLNANQSLLGANTIAKAFINPLDDNEEQIYSVFRQLKTWVQLSQVAYAYRYVYKTDLGYTLKAKLSDEEFNNVVRMVAKYSKV